jgi:hypothetical protein
VLVAAVSPLWGVAAALITAAAGLIGQALVRLRESRDRRREEYGRAYAAAMNWVEFPYRIARRVSDEPDVRAGLVDAMHRAQQDIYFHQGWLRTTSPEICASYDALVAAVKNQTRAHIQEAWGRAGDPAAALENRFDVDVAAVSDMFIESIRKDVSFRRRIPSPGER